MNATTRAAVMTGLMALAWAAHAEQQPKPEDTEVWRPEPARVTPGSAGRAPSDALVLFDGKGLDEWVSSAASTKPADSVRDSPTFW